MKLRTFLLAGLLLSVLTIGFTFGTILLRVPRLLAFLVFVILWYGYAAARRTQPTKAEDILVLRRGLNWGLVIGGSFAAIVLSTLALDLYIATGAVVANVDGQGQRPQVDWIGDGNGSALLVVACENKLTLFKINGPAR